MGMLLQVAVLMSSLLHCSAFPNLSGPSEVKAVWKGSTTLPCTYVPVEDLVQQTLTWMVVHDKGSGTIFRRDDSGDHVLLSDYRDRVSVPKNAPGNVSLLLLDLEISDRGTYTCHVTWRDSNNSLIAKEITTKLEVVKVAATKPTITVGELGLTVPAGASTSLTCETSGSPPIHYRWYQGTPTGKKTFLSSGAELALLSLQPSNSGMYFCEAENRAGDGAVQRSDAVQLTVTDVSTTTATLQRNVRTTERHHSTTGWEKTQTETELVSRGTSGISWTPWGSTTTADLPIAVTTSKSGIGHPGKNDTLRDSQRTGLSLYLVILIAVVCGAVVFLLISLIICIRRPKDEIPLTKHSLELPPHQLCLAVLREHTAQVYDVKFHNSRAAASSRHDSTCHYEEPIPSSENDYVTEPRENKISEEANKNVSDCVGNPQESAYEVGDNS